MSHSKSLHVRRCHVCMEISESTDDIFKCTSCRKTLLPFYYFDKKAVSDYSDNRERPPKEADRSTSPQGYGPIRGLTAYW